MASSIRWITSNLLAAIQGVTSALPSSLPSSSSSSPPESCHTVTGDLNKLNEMLEGIQAVLHDAEEREIRDESVKIWLKKLKDVAYDADDVFDEYGYELLRLKVEGKAVTKETTGKRKREEVSQLITSPLPDISFLNDIARRVKKISERFDDIAKLRDALRLRKEDGDRPYEGTKNPQQTGSLVDESRIYGRDDVKNKVIKILMSEDSSGGASISVLPIIGMGGIGKTTLAQLVYNDPMICQYYDQKGWVCVSDDFDVIKLTKAIIESITMTSCPLTDHLSPLQETLQKKLLKGEKLLLVLDDV